MCFWKYLEAMLESHVNVCCDNYNPDFSDNLIDSLRSYIDTKLDYERKTPEFVSEVRRRLYLIHEYNCQVAAQTCMFRGSRKLDQLLVKYVELEFEVLYFTNGHPPKEVEIITELRVLRLLQVMLYQTVLKNESQIIENADAILKKTVLKILSQVKSTYLAENKLVHNVINKLLNNLNLVHGEINFATFDSQDIHRNLATSDYGTDDDSDFENETFSPIRYNNGQRHQEKSTFLLSSDCMEVPLMVNGVKPIPTVEFPDDDDDDDGYMVYLQKRSPIKRIFTKLSRKYKKKSSLSNGECSKTCRNIDGSVKSTTNNFLKETNNVFNKKYSSAFKNATSEFSGEATCIVVCSDSDEETVQSLLDDDNTVLKEKESIRNDKNKNVKEKQQVKNQGVVTFEIIDDDDDDENGSNYMVYLQREVETNNKSKKRNCKSLRDADNMKEILISDSEEDEVVEIHEKSNVDDQLKSTENKENVSEKSINLESTNHLSKTAICTEVFNFYNPDKIEDILKFVDSEVIDDVNTNNELEQIETCKEVSNENFFNVFGRSVEENLNFSATISGENMNITTFEHEIELNGCENSSTNFLIDPAVIFENMSSTEPSKTKKFSSKSNVHGKIEDSSIVLAAPCFEELSNEKPNTLGGPVLSEKMDDLDDVENLLECRLNDSLLEEILLNDSYLLESHKEFEDLECFLFDDKKEQRFDRDMNNFPIESEDILQPDVINNNMGNLESLSIDTQTLTEHNDKWLFEMNKSVKNCKFKKRRRKRILKLRDHRKNHIRNVSKCNPLKDFTNNNDHQHEEDSLNEYCDLKLEKEQRYRRRRRENTFKTPCRRKIHAVNKR